MTAHSDRIRQAEHAAGVYDDTPWQVGDVAHDPWAEDLPDGAILVDADGDAWKLDEGNWFSTCFPDLSRPKRHHGPFEVVWLPKEADDE